jgi:serine protease inhibitor ecotin|tara:strand:- start:3435 stop:3674 length:240 start_codon:yes stop_codon:yes gene_type:complete
MSLQQQSKELVMKSIITAIAITALFTSSAFADGLADRINEARSYPNKTVETTDRQELCLKHQKLHEQMKEAGLADSSDD